MRKRTAIRLLNKAERRLTGSWCQHVLESSEGEVCLRGAINYAVTGAATPWNPWSSAFLTDRRVDRMGELTDLVRSALPPNSGTFLLSEFNDLPFTTEQDVINLLRAAKTRIRRS